MTSGDFYAKRDAIESARGAIRLGSEAMSCPFDLVVSLYEALSERLGTRNEAVVRELAKTLSALLDRHGITVRMS